MCPFINKIFQYSLLAVVLSVLSACDKVSVPRLTFDDHSEPRIPFSITYAFAPNLLNHTQTVDACGLPYTIPVGEIIAKTFLKVGQNRFNGVRAEPPVGDAQGAPPDGYRVIVDLNQFLFDPVTLMATEPQYTAFVDLKLLVVYEDPQGTSLAQTPLTYHEKVNLFVHALSSSASSCATQQLDGTVENAAEKLAKEMISVMPRLGQVLSPVVTNPSSYAEPSGTTPPSHFPMRNPAPTATPPQPVISPSVQFRTKLVDANRNLILEGGEAVILLIETTNVSGSTIPSAYVELRGTPMLVEAFKRVAPIPMPIGELKAGEKRTAEIRGRIGEVREQLKGELIIGIILSEGLPPGTHTIMTEIQPGPTRKQHSR
ncbi:hypothetical protein [uncultured Nitrospira sp.]|uniref:hypothetical protein n=1 Tax=uncultured Nitrospira sp. TaxID=157176 RepID=UPI00314072D0